MMILIACLQSSRWRLWSWQVLKPLCDRTDVFCHDLNQVLRKWSFVSLGSLHISLYSQYSIFILVQYINEWYISGVIMRKSLIFEINLQHQGLQLSCLISTVPRKFGFFVALYVNVKMPFTRGRPLRQQMMELRAVHALPRPPTLPSSKKICEMESSWIVLIILYKQ